MSSFNVRNDDEEYEIRDVELGEENEPRLRQAKIENESDASVTSSTSSRKQLKSAHTVLKDPPSPRSFEKEDYKNSMASQNSDDKAEHYMRLLQESQQSLASRDTLITMLQEQLGKMQRYYKENLDDTQELRYKYCVTTQELTNLKTINTKYREQIQKMKKESELGFGNDSLISRKEAENWKMQYEDLLKHVQSAEDNKLSETASKVSQETQVELTESQDLKTDVDMLKTHYSDIKDSLKLQNEKLEFLVVKLQQDLKRSEFDKRGLAEKLSISEDQLQKCTGGERCVTTEQLRMENQCLKRELANIKLQNDRLFNEAYNSAGTSNNNKETAEKLKNELMASREEIVFMADKNTRLEMENDNLNNQLNEETGNQRFEAKNSALENLKKENLELRFEVQKLQRYFSTTTDNNPYDCNCASANADQSETPYQLKFKEGRVDFVTETNATEKLEKESVEFRRRTSDDIENLSVELINVRRALKEKEEEIEELNEREETTAETKSEIISQLQKQSDMLKSDLEDCTNINDKLTFELRKKIEEISGNNVTIQNLNTRIEALENELEERQKIKENYEQLLKTSTSADLEKTTMINNLKSQRNDLKMRLSSNTRECTAAFQENVRLRQQLEHNKKELNQNLGKFLELQGKIEVLDKLFVTTRQENEKYRSEIEEHEERKCTIEKMNEELLSLQSLCQTLTKENEDLVNKIKELARDVQRYKEEAQFKKAENDKLRRNEEQMQHNMAQTKQNSDQIIRDYNRKLTTNKGSIDKVTKEYNNYKQEIDNKITAMQEENKLLQASLENKESELTELKETINKLTHELEHERKLHKKDVGTHDRSLSEIKDLYIAKENALAEVALELQALETNLKESEEEKIILRQLLIDKEITLQAEEKSLIVDMREQEEKSRHVLPTIELRTLEENYKSEKLKNEELNRFLNNTREEIKELKVQLGEVMASLETKIVALKMDIEAIKSNNADKSKNNINQMLDCVKKFNSSVLQEPTPKLCQRLKCKEKSDNQCEGTPNEKLLIKREFLTNKLKQIDEKLNSTTNTDNSMEVTRILTPRRISSSESDLTQCNCKFYQSDDVDDLLFQREHYSCKVKNINNQLNNKENQTWRYDYCSPSTIEYWSRNLEIMQKMASDISEMKIGLTTNKRPVNSTIHDKSSNKNDYCPANTGLKVLIADLEQQVKATSVMSNEIDALEKHLQFQQMQLQEFRAGTNKIHDKSKKTLADPLNNEQRLVKSMHSGASEHRDSQISKPIPLSGTQVDGSNSIADTPASIINVEKQEIGIGSLQQNKKSSFQNTGIPVPVNNTTKKPGKCKCPPVKYVSRVEDPKKSNQAETVVKTLYEAQKPSQPPKDTKQSIPVQCACVKLDTAQTQPKWSCKLKTHTPSSGKYKYTQKSTKQCNCGGALNEDMKGFLSE